MEADVYEAYQGHMEKIALDEARLDAFCDELASIEKQAFVGALGGALRGGFAAAKGVGRKLMQGQSVGGVKGALGSIKGRAMRQAGQHGTFAGGATPMRAGAIGPAPFAKGTSSKLRGAAIAEKNRMVGAAGLGVAGMGAGYAALG